MDVADCFYDVLDHGYVALIDKMGSDLTVVNAARVSFAKRHAELVPGDEGLINFMMRERHGSPFEHMYMTLLIKCPIFVAREWFRHRVSSFNEWSGRYSKLEPEFYIPDNVRSQVGKPGAYTFEPVDENLANYCRNLLASANAEAWGAYEQLLDEGVAKEVARMALPVNIYTQFYWTVNARSLMNFLNLRNAETAQWEIKEYAKTVENIFANLWPITYDAYVENARVAP